MAYKDYDKDLEYHRQWWQRIKQENPERYAQHRSRMINNIRRVKLASLQHYSQSEIPFCACCGEKQLEFLTIDHINGDGRKHRREAGVGSHLYAWPVRNNFPDGFQVLCFNCNCSKG